MKLVEVYEEEIDETNSSYYFRGLCLLEVWIYVTWEMV